MGVANTPQNWGILTNAAYAATTPPPKAILPRMRWRLSGFHNAVWITCQMLPRYRPCSSTPAGDIMKPIQEFARKGKNSADAALGVANNIQSDLSAFYLIEIVRR